MALLPMFQNGTGIETWAADGLVSAALEGERERLERIARGWRYYDGDQPNALIVAQGEPDDNVVLNVVETAIDAVSDFMFGERLEMPLIDTDPASDEQRHVDATWRAAGGMSLLGDIRTNGAIAGHTFVKIEVYEGQMTRLVPPRLRALDPATVTVFTSEDDHERVEEYRITWNVVRSGQAWAKRQRIIAQDLGWLIVDEESPPGTARWSTVAETLWPYEWAPVVATKNLPKPNVYYGRPDIDADLMRLQDAINATAGDARRVSRLLGHSQVWASGVDAGDLTADPGEAVILPDDARIGVIGPPATPNAHLELLARFKSAFHEQARVPEITAGRLDGVGQLSGLALSILYGPLVRKVGVARGLYGGLIDTINRRVLELADYDPVGTEPQWPPTVPSDPKERAITAQEQQKAGVSIATSLSTMGVDAETEATQRQVEQEQERAGDLGAAMLAFDSGE